MGLRGSHVSSGVAASRSRWLPSVALWTNSVSRELVVVPIPSKTRPDRHARNSVYLVKRNLTVDATDKLWVSDLTYIGTKEGWLYLVIIMDACSRRILGYKMSDTMDTQLFTRALNQAKTVWGTAVLRTTIFHSDHGYNTQVTTSQEMLKI
jgi:putative transposase